VGDRLAPELACASVQTAFSSPGLTEIIAFALPDNLASRQVMQKTAFAFECEVAYARRPMCRPGGGRMTPC
jgi:RimJ/RimL family protein N-acetyltransferase